MLQFLRCHLQALLHPTQQNSTWGLKAVSNATTSKNLVWLSPNRIGFLLLQFPQRSCSCLPLGTHHSPLGGSGDCPPGALHTILAQYALRPRSYLLPGQRTWASGFLPNSFWTSSLVRLPSALIKRIPPLDLYPWLFPLPGTLCLYLLL